MIIGFKWITVLSMKILKGKVKFIATGFIGIGQLEKRLKNKT